MDQQTEETLAALQAQLAVQQMALRALVRSHPDPTAVLAAWRESRADAVAASYALPPGARHSRWVAELMEAFAEHWTAELVDHAVASTPGGGTPA